MLAIERTRRCGISDQRANAVIFALGKSSTFTNFKEFLPIFCQVRNSDLAGITSTITQLERQFNQHFRYPYVLLNDVPFEQTFKE